MAQETPRRCRHAFESATVHANGAVVCSIIDGREAFVLGNVHEQSLADILAGPRRLELQRLMRSHAGQYCAAIGKRCPLKNIAVDEGEHISTSLRFLSIEPTTACDLRCLTCPVRDFSGDVGWRHAYRDGGAAFAAWDGVRRLKQHAADGARRVLPLLDTLPRGSYGPVIAALSRGRIPPTRRGTLPIDVLKRVVCEAGPGVERIDLFNYGEPFMYRHMTDGLRHIRRVSPGTAIAISTDGMQVREPVETAILSERLLDWLIFSIDGCDEESYRRYRIRGRFATAFANLSRVARAAAGSGIRVVWQYVVFRWNDRDEQLQRAIAMASEIGVPLWLDFAHTWGRSRRRADDLRQFTPYLKPFTAFPGEPRQEGW